MKEFTRSSQNWTKNHAFFHPISNNFITENPLFDIIHVIGPYFCIFKHLYTCHIQFMYLFLDLCICMVMYFDAMRFVSILLDSSKKNVYRDVLIRGMYAHDSWF